MTQHGEALASLPRPALGSSALVGVKHVATCWSHSGWQRNLSNNLPHGCTAHLIYKSHIMHHLLLCWWCPHLQRTGVSLCMNLRIYYHPQLIISFRNFISSLKGVFFFLIICMAKRLCKQGGQYLISLQYGSSCGYVSVKGMNWDTLLCCLLWDLPDPASFLWIDEWWVKMR